MNYSGYGNLPDAGYGQPNQPFLGGGQQGGGAGNHYGNNVEMQQYRDNSHHPQNPFNENTSYSGAPSFSHNPVSILDQCQAVDGGIDELEHRLNGLSQLHRRVLNDQASPAQVDAENADIMAGYRGMGDRLRKIKSNPESGNPRNAPQVGRIDRRLKKAINDYQRVESDFRKQMQEQQARQYRIVKPEASEEEVRQAVEDPNAQIFQQALLNSDRRGQSQSALTAVRARHAEIQRIEQTIVELAQLFQDLDHIVMANEELGRGVKSARAARKKKWICFWICILVLVILIAVIIIYFAVIRPGQNKVVVEAPKATTSKRAVAFGDVQALQRRAVALLLEQ